MSDPTSIVSKEDYLKKYLSKDSDSPKTKTKEEYLKKYVTGEDPASKPRKKRRKKVRQINPGYKIIDDDIDVNHSLAQDNGSDDVGLDDDVPFVVSVEDEFQFKSKLDPRSWTVVGEDSKKEDIGSSKSRHQEKFDSRKENLQHTSRTRGNADRDQSPPRKSRVRYDSDSDQSPARTSKKRHDTGRDHSPPTTSASKNSVPSRSSDSDQSPPRTSKTRHDSDSDQSPPRKHKLASEYSPPQKSTVKQKFSRDHSPPRSKRLRNDSDSDQSPPRPSKGRHDSGSDLSPPRSANEKLKHEHQSDSDQSPPRIRKNDLSTSRGSNKRHDSRSDEPVQKKSRSIHHSDSDQSPPRMSSHSDHRRTDMKRRQRSPQFSRDKDIRRNENRSRERTRERSPHKSDYKRHRSSDSDLSPPRSTKVNDGRKQDGSPRRNNKDDPRKVNERPVKTLSGLKAGLQSAKVLRTELQEAKAKEKENFREIGDDISGKGAQTVFRDRSTGKHRDLKKESEEEQLKKAKENEMKAKYNEWGKGLKQQDDRRKQFVEELHEMNKPLARYEGDEDLERHLKEQEREGDPMLQFIRKKKTEGKIMLPKYQGPPPPPNRFNLLPGYRWDGVDRSNGFEKKLFERQSNRVALEEEAYKWSTENM